MKAVVIGGGLGGLATALRLRVRGWDVTLCEAGPAFGGKMNCLRRGEYSFDTGPSLITMPDVFAELFQAAGEDLREHVPLIRLDPHAEYRFADGTRVICPAGTEAWRDTVNAIEPKDVAGFDSIQALGRKLYELSSRTFFQRSPYARPRLSELAALRYLPIRHAWGRYAAAVEHFFRSPYLRQIYNRYPTYVGSSPWLCPATLLIIPFLEREFGAWYVKGGLYRIIESITSLLVRAGADLRVNARVVSIERNGRRVSGVRLEDGTHVPADAVVMNGDAATLPALLGLAGPASVEGRSLSGLVMMAGIARRPPSLPHHTVVFSSDYRSEFDELFSKRRFPRDPTIYICAPATTDASVAPPGGDALFLMANAPAGGDCMRSAASMVLAKLERAGLRFEPVSEWEIYDPGRFAQQYLAPGGAIYGTHSHGWKRAFYRPANRDPRLRGLYLAGGSTHPGGGTPTVLMSARIVAEMIEADARA